MRTKKPAISFRLTESNERIEGMIDLILVVRFNGQYATMKVPLSIYKSFLARNKNGGFRMQFNSMALYDEYRSKLRAIVSVYEQCEAYYDAKMLRHELQQCSINWHSPPLRKYTRKIGKLIN